MRWALSWRADQRARVIADRHYNRQKVGAPQFVPPGRCLVLLTPGADALWVTSWPMAEYVMHRWAGAWVCSAFRNEGPHLSSELIRDACAATAWRYGEPPPLGMVTFVDRRKVRGKRHFGLCYRHAGFDEDGYTKEEGLLALRLPPERFPRAVAPAGAQLGLLEATP